ncbi:Fic family protein [Fusobacterium varium]|uniref:Fic family protein n=1 Tax=Fusobacterium varium TaxID=856 RepID=UPI00266C8303|nr:Fic family protein [Fusobacterium varium]
MTDEYLEDLLVRIAHHSTAIEGNTLTQADTASILLHNYIPHNMTEREYYEVKNYKKTIGLLLSNQEQMSTELIKEYHKIIMENLVDNNGEYKKTTNTIVGADFETSKPYQVSILLQEWCDNYNFRIKKAQTVKEKIEIIVDQHIKFERIHPFSDGNGRAGRMLMIDSCIKESISPIIIPKEEKEKYINYLATENSKKFTKWGLELQEKELDRIEKFYNKEIIQIK